MSRFRLLFFASLSALAAACSDSESVECEGTGVVCRPGSICTADQTACLNPLESRCGDGVIDNGTNGTEDRGEECDDGGLRPGDGCSPTCRRPVCGDNIRESYTADKLPCEPGTEGCIDELCDDGNTSDGDGCSQDCLSIEYCGDGYESLSSGYPLRGNDLVADPSLRRPGAEFCDPGQGDGAPTVFHSPSGRDLPEPLDPTPCDSRTGDCSYTATCNLDCTVPRCGDGKLNRLAGEQCDPGTGTVVGNNDLALAPSADCNADCTVAGCGDGKTNPLFLPRLGSNQGEQCDVGRFCADPDLTPCTSNEDCLALQTGGVTLGDVECKTRDLPCCTAECFSTTCGDNILQKEFIFPAGLPQSAREACQAAWVPEQCDTGSTVNNDGDGCDSTCKTEECGDGQRSPHAFRRLRALFAEGTPNAEGTGLDYEFEPSEPVTALEVCDDGKHCSVNGKLCQTDDDCLDNQGGVIGDGRCLARNGDGCSADCLSIETCGSGDGFLNDYPVLVFQKGEDLLPVLGPNGQPIEIRANPSAEVCDDGNNTDGDGCAANCFSSGICGNAILDTGELCDYGRQFNGTGIVPDKQVEAFCLPGALPEPQACEFPCNRDCTLNVQGDRKLDPGEQCDDGKTCATGIPCEENADCAEIGGTDLECKHRDDDNCTFSGRINLCGDGLANRIGGWSGLENLTIDARAELEARYGPGGIPLQICDSSGINTVACDRDCTLPVCGDFVVCLNLADSSTCLPNTPLVNFTQGETCDNGPGLAAGQTVESANCNTNCEIAFCGDTVTNVTRGEVCDDGNLDDGDGCAGNCRSAEVCGDNVANRYTITVRNAQNQVTAIRPAEVCDAGPTGSPTCTADCQSSVICGDRYVNANETCDDGNTLTNDGCGASCQTETGWNCPTTTVTVGSPPTPGSVTYTTSQRCVEVCGDGLIAGDETCDNGRQCSNGTACTTNAQCAGIGDGLCQVRAGDGCSATCRTEVGWSCASTSAGPNTLHRIGGSCSAICGDRLIRIGEQCDDGNVDSGDGCSNSCVRELGYTCPCSAEPGFVCGTTGGIGGACGSVCGDGGVIGFEECDDGRHCLVSLGPDATEGTGDDVLRACSSNGDCLGTDANAECRTRSADGCNAGCRTELGWECPTSGGACLPECGDFVIRGVEDCDDGRQCLNANNNVRTPCSTNADCAAVPGDGLCTTRSGDGCATDCTFEPGYTCPAGLEVIGGECVAVCGDGLVRGEETCDDGDTTSGDGCDSGCRAELGWTCPINVGVNGAGGDCAPTCADGLIRGNETCDEGAGGSAANGVTGGCVNCVQQAGWVCPTALLQGGNCASRCGDNIRVTTARPGFTANNEECDAGAANSNSGDCTLTCRNATCTDGFRNFIGTHKETDVDCGGTCSSLAVPVRCALNKGCTLNTDCQTNYCDTLSGLCANPPLAAPTLYVLEGNNLTINVRTTLFGGNNQIDLNTFEVTSPLSSCSGDVVYNRIADPNTVTFTPEPAATATVGAGCTVGTNSAYSDSFSYRVCSLGGAPCFTSTATVIVNRRPVVADAARCLPINTNNASLDIQTLYTDADAHPLNAASITNTGAGGTHTRNGSTITFTPTNAATPSAYSVAINACDAAPQTPGCDTATWSLQWNDPPVVAGRTGGSTINVFAGEAATAVPLYTAADRIITNNGTVNNAIASVTVGAFNNGPFGASTTTARGSCTVSGDPLTNGTIVFTAGSTTGTDSCFVRVCETCSASELCSVAELRYNIAPVPVANDDQVFALEAANPVATGATGTFTVASLQTNDTPAGLINFAFVSATTTCGGTVVNNAGTITYTGPANASPACRTADTFSYRVCSPVITTRCDDAVVNIEVNRRPVLADTFTCSPISTPNRSINVNDLFTDADGDLLKSSSILATGGSGTSNRVGNVVTWTPTNAATATTYTVNLTACDDGGVEGCDTAVWTARWNDPPELRAFPDSAAIAVVRTEQSSLAISTGGSPILISTGAVTGVQAGDPIASTAVGAFSVGPFSQNVTTSLGGTCAITGGNVVYTAANTAGNDSCFVQVCETCSGNNVCAVTRIPFKVINAPAPVADSVQAAEGSDNIARGTFPIATLVANDQHINTTTFALKNGTGTPSCAGAVVTSNGTNVTYVGPAIAGCGTTDSFVYTVCSPDIPTRCADATVTIDINRRPALAAGFTCMPQNSVRGTYTVGAPNFTDSDGDGVGTVQATSAGQPGLATVAGAVVTWAPDNATTPRYYDVSLNVCDNASSPSCTTGTWRASWNDAPTLSSTFTIGCASPTPGQLCVGASTSIDLPLEDADPTRELISDFGVVVGVPAGAPTPIGAVTITAQGAPSGSCAVVENAGVATAIRYTAGATPTGGTPDTCTVRVCELCNGGDVCSTRTINFEVFAASNAVADEFGVLSTSVAVPTVTVPRSFFTDNDVNIAPGSFSLPSGTTSCGGTVSISGSDLLYTKPANPVPCAYVDTFTYTVNRNGIGGTTTGNVSVRINRPPTLTFTDLNSFVCQPVGTANTTLNLVPDIYSDPDDGTSTLSLLTATEANATFTTSLANKTVQLTPTNAATARRYATTVTARDSALNNAANDSRGTATGTWNAVWNDPPTFDTVAPIRVGEGDTTAALPFADIVDTFGTVNGLPVGSASNPWASVQVGAAMGGPFSTTADLGNGSSCAVTGTLDTSSVTFTAGGGVGTKSCYVQVCEVCGATPVCAVKELQYTIVDAVTDTFAAAEQVPLEIDIGDDLLTNDINVAEATFTLVDFVGPTASTNTADGGLVSFDGVTGKVTYLAKAGASATDTFVYRACHTSGSPCDDVTVNINVNRSPNLGAAQSCVGVGTANVSFDLNPAVSPTYTDPENQALGVVTFGAVTVDAGASTGAALAAGTAPNELRLTPNAGQVGVAARYLASYTAADTGTPAASRTGTWTVLYNDAPTLKAPPTFITATSTVTVTPTTGAQTNQLVDTFGVIEGGVTTVTVSATSGAGHAATATLDNGGCAVQGDNSVVFTPSLTPSADTDICYVRICECGNVCTEVAVTFTVVECQNDGECSGNPAGDACNVGTNTCGCVDNLDCPTTPTAKFCGAGGVCHDPYPITYCKLQHPPTQTLLTNATFTVFARFFAGGLTGNTAAATESPADPRGLIRVQSGYGASNSTPDGTWTWFNNGTANAMASYSPGELNDEWMSVLTAPATAGARDYAVRVSGDGGVSWLVCDLDGVVLGANTAPDNYTPAQAGKMTVNAP